MPWEKQFERDAVLEKAMHAFWQHGYDGTSMKDLISCMGLNPGSIYATFGDKKALFCEALQLYQLQVRDLLESYEDKFSPPGAILAVFEALVDDVRNGSASKACFLINSVVEVASDDEQIEQLTKDGLNDLECFFRRMIVAGQASGEIGPAVCVHKTARLLVGLVIGGRVLGRGHCDASEIQDYQDHAAALLK